MASQPDYTDPNSGAYRDYQQSHSYELDPGILYLPVASREPTRPARIVLHGGYGTRTVDWSAIKLNNPPTMPNCPVDRDEDYDTYAEMIADSERADDAAVRPLDRVVSSVTVVDLPIPNVDNGTYTFSARGRMVLVQAGPLGPRVPGVDALPTGRRPFYLGRLDDQGGDLLSGFTFQSNSVLAPSQQLSTYLITKPDMLNEDRPWPITVFPETYFVPQLYQE